MPRGKLLSEIVNILPRFRRSSSIVRDWGREESIDGYIITPIGKSIIQRIAISLNATATTRSWSLTGPYGSGKSAFAGFLVHLLSSPTAVGKEARRMLREADITTHDALFSGKQAKLYGALLHPVLVGGQFSSLSGNLIDALRKSLALVQAKTARLKKFTHSLEDVLCHLRKRPLEPIPVLSLFEEAMDILVTTGGLTGGIVLVIDELGKHLEFAAKNTSDGDVFLLQELAEWALRCSSPFLVLTVLHQSFDRYTSHISTRRRTEWAKVQGRFEDIVFEEPTDQVLRLVASAFTQGQSIQQEKALRSQGETLAEEAWDSEFFPTVLSKKEYVQHLGQTFPIHPSVSMLLGPLFRQIAQNERSLFAFLCSGEPYGFASFLSQQEFSQVECASYRLDHLYDYITSALGSSLITQYRGKHWAEVQANIQRVQSATPLVIRTAKIVGLLQAIGHARGCPASKDFIRFALRDHELSDHEVDKALSDLESRSVCIYRRHADSYVLWEGSDVDFQSRMEEARRNVNPRHDLTLMLQQIAPVRPIVAKRHSYKTGTLRYIDIAFANAESLVNVASAPLGSSDGRIVYCLPVSDADRDTIMRQLKEAQLSAIPWLIAALPEQTLDLQDVCYEISCLHWIRENTPEISHDPVASRELGARLHDADQALHQMLQGMYTPTSELKNCHWLHQGEELSITSPRSLNDELSNLCDEVYKATPLWRNELINRRALSSSAAAARRNLIEAMLSKPHMENLGIEGFPPERSMYESILNASGLHRELDGNFGFHRPGKRDPGLRLVWKAVDHFLESCDDSPRPLIELFSLLQAPPYGLKEGILPVLFTCVVLCYDAELAIYETNSFVPQLTVPMAERMLRAPADFSVQRCRIVGPKAFVFSQYSQLLQKPREISIVDKPSLLGVVRPLLKFAKSLPDYVRNTQQVSVRSKAILSAIEAARNPDELLFKDLPVACGCNAITDHTDTSQPEVKSFFEHLRTSLGELQQAYTRLLSDVRQQFMQTFSIQGSFEDFRREIYKRSRLVSDIAVDSQLRAFLNRVIDTPGDDDSWLESIAALLANRPLTQWNDQDRARFEVNLVLMARTFSHFEALAFEMESKGAALLDGDDTALRIAVTVPRQKELERVVRIPPRLRQSSEAVQGEILDMLRSRNLLGTNEIGAAVLAQIVRDLLNEDVQKSGPVVSEKKL